MALPRLLDSLLRAHGPSGHEHLAYDAIREAVGEVAAIETDAIGNLVARAEGTGDGLGASHGDDRSPIAPVSNGCSATAKGAASGYLSLI